MKKLKVTIIGFLLTLTLCFATSLLAEEKINDTNQIPSHDVTDDNTILRNFPLGLLIDAKNELGISEISSLSLPFSLSSSRIRLWKTKANHWFVFRLVNTSRNHIDRVIRFPEVFMEEVELFYQNDGEFVSYAAGLSVPIHERQVQNRAAVFSIKIEAGETKIFYIRLFSRFVHTFEVVVESPSSFYIGEQWRSSGYWAYFGAAAAILFYNLFVYFSVRDPNYLYYVIYGMLFLVFALVYSGYSFYVADTPDMHYDLHISIAFVFVFLTIFTRKLLQTEDAMPRIDRILYYCTILFGALGALIVITVDVFAAYLGLAMIYTLVLLFVGIAGMKLGIEIAQYYVVAIGTMQLGLFIKAMSAFGFFPTTFFTNHSYLLGALLELILFSMALGYKLKLLQQEKLAYQSKLVVVEKDAKEKLEEVVKKRTAQLYEANQKLERMATIDGLSGIYNRRYFDSKLEEEWNRLQRDAQPISLIMIDIDHFKKYNDIAGHQAGDDCIREVAKIIDNCVGRGSDLAARYGGEEFAVILPATGLQGAKLVADCIMRALKQSKLEHPHQDIERVTVSIGIATTIPTQPPGSQALVASADKALYSSKRKGRNQITCGE